MAQPTLGIDVSKQTLDVSIIIRDKPRHHQFANSEQGSGALIAWLRRERLGPVHACMEATGRYGLAAAWRCTTPATRSA